MYMFTGFASVFHSMHWNYVLITKQPFLFLFLGNTVVSRSFQVIGQINLVFLNGNRWKNGQIIVKILK